MSRLHAGTNTETHAAWHVAPSSDGGASVAARDDGAAAIRDAHRALSGTPRLAASAAANRSDAPAVARAPFVKSLFSSSSFGKENVFSRWWSFTCLAGARHASNAVSACAAHAALAAPPLRRRKRVNSQSGAATRDATSRAEIVFVSEPVPEP